jgi:hypothetical protein
VTSFAERLRSALRRRRPRRKRRARTPEHDTRPQIGADDATANVTTKSATKPTAIREVRPRKRKAGRRSPRSSRGCACGDEDRDEEHRDRHDDVAAVQAVRNNEVT